MEDMPETVRFTLHHMIFEYDAEKNITNLQKHGISFKNAALVFLDYNRVEFYDELHSTDEERYQTIGAAALETNRSAEMIRSSSDAILFVFYTERAVHTEGGKAVDVTRIISARKATSFERGIYYGKYN